MKKAKKVTIVDFDDAIEEAINKRVITKKESACIISHMRDCLDGFYWELYRESFDVPEDRCMSEKEADILKRFYTLFKRYESPEPDSEHGLGKIMFDCAAWS